MYDPVWRVSYEPDEDPLDFVGDGDRRKFGAEPDLVWPLGPGLLVSKRAISCPARPGGGSSRSDVGSVDEREWLDGDTAPPRNERRAAGSGDGAAARPGKDAPETGREEFSVFSVMCESR